MIPLPASGLRRRLFLFRRPAPKETPGAVIYLKTLFELSCIFENTMVSL